MPPKFSRELVRPVIYAYYMDYQPRTSPCETYCPAGNPIQKVNALLNEKRFEEALEYIRAKNPFPGICGRVCPHPCERECNRNKYDEGISIRALERAAFDYSDMARFRRPLKMQLRDKKVAIIGAGPAGMTCAYFLALFGYEVTIYEASSSLGGMTRLCVPDYRLSKDVVDREVGQILELGIHAQINTMVGRDISFAEIKKQHDACLLAVGTWKAKKIDVPGAALAISGLSFLKQVNSGFRHDIGDKVVIVGGGGVAFDCAFTARRLGASEIHVVCLEDKDRMVAHVDDILQGEDEGIIVHNSNMISAVVSEKGKVIAIEHYDVARFCFDNDGSLDVSPYSPKKHVLPADTVIFAAGETPDFSLLEKYPGFRFNKNGTLQVDDNVMTSVRGVFAAGDAVTGASSIAGAIGSGRHAAIAIDNYLNKNIGKVSSISLDHECNIIIEKRERSKNGNKLPHMVTYDELMNLDYFEKKDRTKLKSIEYHKSPHDFVEINKGYNIVEASIEAGRCFHCGHCFKCGMCVDDCPGNVLDMSSDGPLIAYPEECWHCGSCRMSCPCGAVLYQFPLYMLI
jgi:NADPH-dependent glutamate synthase beta subunit-like oxidoreductase/NAD-dependent dihydropyrimidine dehydrogenase PreA subunit